MDSKASFAMIIGAAIADVVLQPVDENVFSEGSHPVEHIALTLGGDALNESITLARLNCAPVLVTRLGRDDTARMIRTRCEAEGVALIAQEDSEAPTGINAVLVAPDGERSFVTNRNGTLRKLSEEDVMAAMRSDVFENIGLICLASLFVSPLLGVDETARLFQYASQRHKIICADMTTPKNGETAASMRPALQYVDHLFANLEEARRLTGKQAEKECALALLSAGAKHVIIKLGARGCLLATRDGFEEIPACQAARCIDTTGAGDTFAAGYIAALASAKSPRECARYGAAAASLCVEQIGATTARIHRETVKARLAQDTDYC